MARVARAVEEQNKHAKWRRRRRPAAGFLGLRWRPLMSVLADGGDSASITAGALAALAARC